MDPKTPGKKDPKSHTKPEESASKPPKTYKTAPITTATKPNYHSIYKFNKRAFGRPSKYKPKYCQEIIDYFNRPHTETYEETHTNRKGETWTASKLRAVPVATLQGFSVSIGVTLPTLRDWKNNFKDFSSAYSHAQALQLNHLATVTGLGLYNSNWAVFMAKNVSDWRDKRDVEHSGDIGISGLIEGLSGKAEQARAERSRIAGQN